MRSKSLLNFPSLVFPLLYLYCGAGRCVCDLPSKPVYPQYGYAVSLMISGDEYARTTFVGFKAHTSKTGWTHTCWFARTYLFVAPVLCLLMCGMICYRALHQHTFSRSRCPPVYTQAPYGQVSVVTDWQTAVLESPDDCRATVPLPLTH
jgi:hypothetical protein